MYVNTPAHGASSPDFFNVRNYGAIGDGTSHPVSSTLGITTLAGLAAYTVNGKQPFSFAASYPFGTLFNLPIAANAPLGATSLSFAATQTTSASASPGAYVLQVSSVAGLSQGDVISGTGIATGTQIDLVNPATNVIRLSQVTTGAVASGATLSTQPYWLQNVVVGMQVSGPPGIASGTLVAGVSAGTVSLSAATTAPLLTNTSNSASAAVAEAAQITFYAPYTNAQAAALEVDGLAINAAIQAATAGVGNGTVLLPGGIYLKNMPIIFSVGVASSTGVSLLGSSGVVISDTADLGLGAWSISCGDPSATSANGRGIYAGGGSACEGKFDEFNLALSSTPLIGRRPQIAGLPVAMNGINQGPRRNMYRVAVSGYNTGIGFAEDWTQWNYDHSAYNFIGFRLRTSTANLYDDLNFANTFFGGNDFAGVSIAPVASIQGTWFNSWIADQPYQFWFEPGAGGTTAITDTMFMQLNTEGAGCGLMVDGNTNADTTGQLRGVQNVTIDTTNAFASNSGQVSYPLPEGCVWNAYFDMNYAYGLNIIHIPANSFYPVANGKGMLRLRTVSTSQNNGGVLISGQAMQNIASNYALMGQELVTGALTGPSLSLVTIESPGQWKAREFLYADPNTGLAPIGSLVEGKAYFGSLAVQLAGNSSSGTTRVLGSVLVDYGSNSMSGKNILVGYSGQSLPVLVTAGVSVGTPLKVSTTPGMAAAAASITDGVPVGTVTDYNNGSSSLVYMKPAF